MIDEKTKKNVLARLKRIEGQVKALARMTEEEQYCIDIMNQVNAVRRALEQVALIVMKRHVGSCVAEAFGTKKEGEKVKELISTIDRFIR